MALSQYLKENTVSGSLQELSIKNFLSSVSANGQLPYWQILNNCPACQSDQIEILFDKWSFEYWECKSCCHQFVNPMPNDESLAEWYQHSESFRDYQKRSVKTHDGRKEHIYEKRWKQLCDIDNGFDSLLEIGCGEGDFLRYVAEQRQELRLIGCDIARPVLSPVPEQFEFIFGSAVDVLNGQHSAELICMYELIEHIPNPKQLLDAIYQGAAPGTRLIMSTPNNQGFDTMMLGKSYHVYLPPGHINLFSPSSIKALLQRIGFKSINILANGTMDVAIVRNYYQQGKWQADTHWQKIFDEDNQDFIDAYQVLLAEHNMAGNLLVSAVV